jgi:UDPglucose 6-dehydrogenase
MRIAVIGAGYVGLVSAACFAELGHEVICVDNDHVKIAALARGDVAIHERFLPVLLSRHLGKRLRFSTSPKESVGDCEAIFITVGTPESETGEADLSCVNAVACEIATMLRGSSVIIEKSTVPVSTCDSLRRVLSLSGAGADSFSVASNPEFLREGSAVTDFLYPDRIVIGVDDQHSACVLKAIYEPLTSGTYYDQEEAIALDGHTYNKAHMIVTTAKSAELIKHASNAFLAMKISFINAVATIAETVGADIGEVCSGIGADSRIGSKFLNAGIGFGGSCFPKDVQAFHAVANQCNYDFGLLTEVMRINAEQRLRFVKKVKIALWTLRGKRLAVLGLAFKGDTDDIRESPAVAIIRDLLKEGVKVQAYDPAAMPKAKDVLGNENVVYANDPYEAVNNCDALLILTEWKEFAHLDLDKIRLTLKHPIVIDGRNLYSTSSMSQAGLIYYSVGRAVAVPETSVGSQKGEVLPATILSPSILNPNHISLVASTLQPNLVNGRTTEFEG